MLNLSVRYTDYNNVMSLKSNVLSVPLDEDKRQEPPNPQAPESDENNGDHQVSGISNSF